MSFTFFKGAWDSRLKTMVYQSDGADRTPGKIFVTDNDRDEIAIDWGRYQLEIRTPSSLDQLFEALCQLKRYRSCIIPEKLKEADEAYRTKQT